MKKEKMVNAPNIIELLKKRQNDTSKYVMDCLKLINQDFETDTYGNIFYLDYEQAPLLSAHMDTVRKEGDFPLSEMLVENNLESTISSGGILGGDDKCGVYAILKVLFDGHKVNFVFSRDEEIGMVGITNLTKDKSITDKIIKNCLYFLVLDRKGSSDIICSNNYYGIDEFEKALVKVSDDRELGFIPKTGLCSDADVLNEYLSGANLSVGYYFPHSQKEFILKKDLLKSIFFVEKIIENVKEKFETPEKIIYDNYVWKSIDNDYNEYSFNEFEKHKNDLKINLFGNKNYVEDGRNFLREKDSRFIFGNSEMYNEFYSMFLGDFAEEPTVEDYEGYLGFYLEDNLLKGNVLDKENTPDFVDWADNSELFDNYDYLEEEESYDFSDVLGDKDEDEEEECCFFKNDSSYPFEQCEGELVDLNINGYSITVCEKHLKELKEEVDRVVKEY